MTAEQAAWLNRADQALEASVILKDTEHFNDAISRAYYAMFYAATMALLSNPGKTFRRHATVHNMFLDYWVKAGKIEPDYHRYLTTAFDARNKADYAGDEAATKDDADLHILHAEAFIRRIRELLQDTESN